MSEEETIDNPNNAEYSSKSDFSKAEVVRVQVLKCEQVRSQEMREGYFNYNQFGNKVYVPDSRQEWIASVKALLYLLTPEISRNKFKTKVKEILDKEEKLVDTFGVVPLFSNGKKVIPVLDQSFPIEVGITNREGIMVRKIIERIKGVYNHNFHGYWNEKVAIHDELFQELHNLIDICNYFKQKVSY